VDYTVRCSTPLPTYNIYTNTKSDCPPSSYFQRGCARFLLLLWYRRGRRPLVSGNSLWTRPASSVGEDDEPRDERSTEVRAERWYYDTRIPMCSKGDTGNIFLTLRWHLVFVFLTLHSSRRICTAGSSRQGMIPHAANPYRSLRVTSARRHEIMGGTVSPSICRKPHPGMVRTPNRTNMSGKVDCATQR